MTLKDSLERSEPPPAAPLMALYGRIQQRADQVPGTVLDTYLNRPSQLGQGEREPPGLGLCPPT